MSHTNGEHGRLQSYTIGFLLSLIFTAIPYYLVVSKSVTGTTLLATILGIAVLQMAIQIFFFLHLGRGPKPLYNIVFFVSTIGIILVVVLGSIIITNNLNYTKPSTSTSQITTKLAQEEAISQVGGEKTGACSGTLASHKIIISNGLASPLSTQARRCDTLTFINQDDTARSLAFGQHLKHQPYGGNSELTVSKGYAKTITLNQSGTYQFHDHTNPNIAGNFTVSLK